MIKRNKTKILHIKSIHETHKNTTNRHSWITMDLWTIKTCNYKDTLKKVKRAKILRHPFKRQDDTFKTYSPFRKNNGRWNLLILKGKRAFQLTTNSNSCYIDVKRRKLMIKLRQLNLYYLYYIVIYRILATEFWLLGFWTTKPKIAN